MLTVAMQRSIASMPFDNIIVADFSRLDLVVADKELGRVLGCAALDRLNDEAAIRVVRGIVRVFDKRRFRRRRRLNNEAGQDRVERQLCLLAGKGDFRARDGLLCWCSDQARCRR